MDNAIGFFGFEVDGDVKLANVEVSYESFAPHYLDWVRDANREELLRMVSVLRTIPIDSDKDSIAQAFGYGDSAEFTDKVGSFPEGVLEEALNNPREMLYNGVVYGTTRPSDFQRAEYGYIVNMSTGSLDCYIGNQIAPHDSGAFFAVEPHSEHGSVAQQYGVSHLDVYAPRMYASYDWDKLPTKADFLSNHYRALMMQEDLNKLALDKTAKETKKRNSLLSHIVRGKSVREDTVCGVRVKSNGQPCVLRSGHGGNHRSRI